MKIVIWRLGVQNLLPGQSVLAWPHLAVTAQHFLHPCVLAEGGDSTRTGLQRTKDLEVLWQCSACASCLPTACLVAGNLTQLHLWVLTCPFHHSCAHLSPCLQPAHCASIPEHAASSAAVTLFTKETWLWVQAYGKHPC